MAENNIFCVHYDEGKQVTKVCAQRTMNMTKVTEKQQVLICSRQTSFLEVGILI